MFSDLGTVEQLTDGSGNLQDQYVLNSMQIRLTGTTTGSGDGGTFTAFYPSVFGLDDYSVDVKDISPTTQNGEPSSSTGDEVTRTYTVKVNNYGAASDSAVVDFVITAPANSFVTLMDGTNAIMDSILQQGRNTYVTIKPISGSWGNGRDDLSGGDQTAYINSDGQIQWPSGTVEIGGPTGWGITPQELLHPLDTDTKNRVVITGAGTIDELAALYSEATVFCYPSLLEGFGLPVLEAMSYRTPVVTSKGTSTEEVAGDAALAIDPNSAGDLADALRVVLSDRRFARELAQRGYERSSAFSWDSAASATVGVYRSLL